MKQIIFLIYILLGVTTISSAKHRIAPYILDGSLVIYTPTISQGVTVWASLMKKMSGIEYANETNRLSVRLVEKISANVFVPEGAKALGIDYNGGVAYVQLNKDVSYMIFTIENKTLLQSRLDNLKDPVPYRIVEEFVIFSASPEILEYYEFKGLGKIDSYNKVAKELSLSWNKNLIWFDSSFFDQDVLRLMGDRVIGTFNIVDNQLVFDVVTVYDDPQINQEIINSSKVSPVQMLTMLDYESGRPSIVGNLYVNLENFLQFGKKVDQADLLKINLLIDSLKKWNIDLRKNILPYLQGRFSYVVRHFKPDKHLYDLTITVGVKNKNVLKQKIKEIAQISRGKGLKVQYKDLFTQQFYGWNINGNTVWVGMIEDHFVVSSDESSLITYVQNVYQSKSGFLRKLPISMRRSIANRRIGGQMILQNPEFIQNVELLGTFINRDLLLSVKQAKWDFYFINNTNMTGRRDILILEFPQ